eukprot:129667_1
MTQVYVIYLVLAYQIIWSVLCAEFITMNDGSDKLWKSKNFTSIQMRNLAVNKVLNDHQSFKQSGYNCGLPAVSVKRYVLRKIFTGDVLSEEEVKKKHDMHYKRPYTRYKIDCVCGALIHGLIEESQLTLDELVLRLREFGYAISRSGVDKYLAESKLTLKVISRVANECHPESVEEFWRDVGNVCTDFTQLLWLDETWRNDKSVNKKRGRSLRGTRCYFSINMTRGRYKINCLLACNYTGPLCWDLYASGIDSQTMNFFLEHQLSHVVTPWPGPNSILILDNHYSHDYIGFFEWARRMGIYLIFEPPHYPIINVCEWCFGAIKAKERHKGIFGSFTAAIHSLNASIEECVGCNWIKVLQEIGYVD